MTDSGQPRVFSIPAGVPFLDVLAQSLLDGTLVPGFRPGDDPLALADATIYVPTRRAARALRSIFVERGNGRAAILPSIRPLGDIDEDGDAFIVGGGEILEDAPPIAAVDRLLLLAPLVQQWKHRIPAHLAQLYGEEVVVPASAADALWLARDLAALMDEVETEDADWAALAGLVEADHAGWWQLTLEFLDIVTGEWPRILQAFGHSNPAAHRRRAILAEARRLSLVPRHGPVVAAGSTGSIPATAEFLAAIARHDQGAVVLPGLDRHLDRRSWETIGAAEAEPQTFGHPQFGLRKLLSRIGIDRDSVVEIGAPDAAIGARMRLASIAMRPAETTDEWSSLAAAEELQAGLDDVALIEAAHEREEAASIAVALRHSLEGGAKLSALVTGDRDLARRVSAELRRFGIVADDSAGLPLSRTPQAELLALLATACLRPGDPVPVVALLKHPFLRLGKTRNLVRHAADTVELVALRGGAGRPDIAALSKQFKARLGALRTDHYRPFWWNRQLPGFDAAFRICAAIEKAVEPLTALRKAPALTVPELARATAAAMENLCRDEDGSLAALYDRDEGEALAGFLRGLVGAQSPFAILPAEWPEVLDALIATEGVRPRVGAESRVVIWGPLEARLQHVDMMVIGSLNEGVWPRAANADRFMSRFMKAGMALEPPERRTGLAAHDFAMALGSPKVVLSRAARSGEAPAVPSRWLQRLAVVAGPDALGRMQARGNRYLAWARGLDTAEPIDFAPRPRPTPPLEARPKRFSVTEIETLRRDPYAVYAKRILALQPVEPLLQDPGVRERGNLLHDIVHRFTEAEIDLFASDAGARLIAIGKTGFSRAGLPEDVAAVWWPRFVAMVPELLHWERTRFQHVARKFSEIAASELEIADTGVRLRGRADRIDLLADGSAEILDFKTGSTPSRRQAQTLVSPQLALEAGLLRRGAFAAVGPREPADLLYVRLKANGEVIPESILRHGQRTLCSAVELADSAWQRLEELLRHYRDPEAGYISRALPFREGDFDGDYDHLARVLEWSAGPGESEEP